MNWAQAARWMYPVLEAMYMVEHTRSPGWYVWSWWMAQEACVWLITMQSGMVSHDMTSDCMCAYVVLWKNGYGETITSGKNTYSDRGRIGREKETLDVAHGCG